MKPRLLFQLPAWSSGWIEPRVSPDWSGLPVAKMNTTTAATIAMCHHTLTWLSRATRLMPAMLRNSWMMRITPIVTSWPLSTPETNDGGVEGRPTGDLVDDRGVDEPGRGIVDAGDDGELADEVEPGGPPAPVLVLHLGGPVVEASGRRIGRGELGHRCGDREDEDGDERPADHHRGGPGPGEAVVVEDDRAGQDRDDRETDREVAESAHRAEQLLGIAQAVQVLDVLLDLLFPCGHRVLLIDRAPPDSRRRVRSARGVSVDRNGDATWSVADDAGTGAAAAALHRSCPAGAFARWPSFRRGVVRSGAAVQGPVRSPGRRRDRRDCCGGLGPPAALDAGRTIRAGASARKGVVPPCGGARLARRAQ